ncbi:MAG: hypothetical protein IPK16_32445 [Anaerolineales bacterium]|nr:hypothetical protein [Anaerolineales bacterium]
MELFAYIIGYFLALFWVVVHAMFFDPEVYAFGSESPYSFWLVLGVMFLAGVSTLLGQSVILFINRVRRGRFVVSLVTNGLLFVVQYVVWGIVIGIVGRFIFQFEPQPGAIVRLVGLSTAPLVLGFLVLIPYLGAFIGKLLNVWVFLIQVVIITEAFHTGFWRGVIAVGAGWLIMLLMTNTIGKPVVRMRNFFWKRVTGTPMEATAQDILLSFSGAGETPVTEGAAPGGSA